MLNLEILMLRIIVCGSLLAASVWLTTSLARIM
jgi:hypothetical protein